MPPPRRRSIAQVILFITLIAGTLDIADALLFYGLRFHIAPALLLQSLASHLLGQSAFSDGVPAAALGLAIHYTIAAFWISLFVLAARRIPSLVRYAFAAGAAYGLLIYATMTYVVLPIIPRPIAPSYNLPILINGVLALVVFMGITVALLNRRFAPLPSVS
jgi:hypothetical protein